MSASLVFETPTAGLVAFAAVAPIAAFLLGERLAGRLGLGSDG